MFGVDSSELIIIAVAALLFIGPKDLPRVMRTVGQWVGRARGMARHFSAGIENMIREAELEEMERKWREENERIMRLYPSAELDADAVMLPKAAEAPPEQAAAEEPQLPFPPASDEESNPPAGPPLP
jgi:sec-independent protein translocase protein TatB